MIRFWNLICKSPAVIGRALLPPATFELDEAERAFLAYQARRTAPRRRAGGILALFTWVAFSGLDILNVGPGSGAEGLFPEILSLRVLGTAAVAAGTFLTFRPKFLEHYYSSRMLYIFISLCYLLLLGMVTDIEFPFSYLVDYPGLILYLMFALGLLRPNARLFLAVVATVLPVSAFELHLSNLASIKNFSHSPGADLHAPLSFFASYYYASTMIYLTVSMAVGYAIACQLERDARDTFLRERELEHSNRTLVEARQVVESRTRDLVAAKEELLESAVRASREKSKFLTEAVHDLKPAISALNIFTGKVRGEVSQSNFQGIPALIELAHEAIQTASRYLDAVLEFSRLESGLVKPELTVFEVEELVTGAVAPLRIVAKDKGVKMLVCTARSRGTMVLSDRFLLQRVLANLTENAVKYSDPAKGARRKVLVRIRSLPNWVRIEVIDNGIGIPQSRQEEVFLPFAQLGNKEHNSEKGQGLGLSIVKTSMAILPLHDLAMRSVEGRGTCFRLEVPRYLAAAPLTESVDLLRRTLDLASLFVWCVEDDQITQAPMNSLLMELGILTERTASVEETARELRLAERRPDLLVICDRLPGGHIADEVLLLFDSRWDTEVPAIVLAGGAAEKSGTAFRNNVEVLDLRPSPADVITAIQRLCFTGSAEPAAEE